MFGIAVSGLYNRRVQSLKCCNTDDLSTADTTKTGRTRRSRLADRRCPTSSRKWAGVLGGEFTLDRRAMMTSVGRRGFLQATGEKRPSSTSSPPYRAPNRRGTAEITGGTAPSRQARSDAQFR